MKVAMVHTSVESENAMSVYSLDLIDSIAKADIEIRGEQYTLHKPSSLFKSLPSFWKYDIIHIQHEYNILGWKGIPFFPLLLLLKFFFKGKVILTMHTVPSKKAEFEGSKFLNFLRKTLYFAQNRWIKHFSDHIIVHCDFFKSILIDEHGFENRKITVIPQAVKEGIKTMGRETARKDLGLSGKVFLIIGTFDPDHGAGDVVKQANKIDGTILIVTNPSPHHQRNKRKVLEYLEHVRNLARDTNIKSNVRFDLKEIPFDLWWKYFSASDLVLLPYRGGLGSGIFSDSIAMKIPMVGSDIPYFREYAGKYKIIEIAKKGDFASAINRSMKDENYKRMKKVMEEYVREFGISSIGKNYRSIYEKVLNKI